MPQTFGTRLRRHRERQEIDLASIAAETKIALPLLEGLEADSVSHWPSGIFRRAFIRAYAHAIGLQPDEVVHEFLERHPDPVEALTVEPLVAAGAHGGRPPTRLGCFLSKFYARVSGSAAASPAGAPPIAHAPTNIDLLAAANLCEKLAQADASSDITLLLREAVRVLDAIGLIVWAWDSRAAELKPARTEGYSASVLAQLPKVRRDTDNATAAAFRSARTCAVRAGDTDTAALAVPVMSPEGCVGVLTVELSSGGEQVVSVRAVVTMFAAHLGRLTPKSSVLAGFVEVREPGLVEFSEPHHDQIGSRVHTQIVHATHG
jgi:hypothetical protein